MNDEDDDVNGTTVSLIDCGIKSLTSLTLQPRLVSLNLHSNAITKIENLAHLQNLVHLDLSSNRIAKITGLQALVSLRALNLTCNLLVSIENLSGLKKLAHLNLAYNKLQYVHGLGDLWGNEYGLETLLLASNYLSSTEEVTYYLSGLTRLKHVTLVENEFLRHSDYRSYLFKHMRSLISVDGKDRASRPVKPSGFTPSAFLEISPLKPTHSKKNPTPAVNESRDDDVDSTVSSLGPKLDLIEDKIHKLLLIRDKLKPQPTTQHNDDNNIHLRDRSNFPSQPVPPESSSVKSRAHQNSRLTVGGGCNGGINDSKCTCSSSGGGGSISTESSSSNSALNELIRMLQEQIATYKQSQEGNVRVIEDLKRNLEQCYSDNSKIVKDKEELIVRNNEATVKLQKELGDLRSKLEQLENVQNMHQTNLNKREEKLKQHYTAQLHAQKEAYEAQLKHEGARVHSLEVSYKSLEDEFRSALVIEAQRHNELVRRFEATSEEASRIKVELEQAKRTEERNTLLINELNELIKEQKARLHVLVRFRKETVEDVQKRNSKLSEAVTEGVKLKGQLDLVKKEKNALETTLKKILTELDEIKRERHTWQQKLNEQKHFLLQENSRLEVEAKQWQSDCSQMREQLAKEADSCKIKAKIIEDQTETIRKMKNALVESNETVKKCRDEALESQKSLERQLNDEMDLTNELKLKLNGYSEIKRAYDELSEKWREKSELIGELDGRVRKMKEGYEKKEVELSEKNEQLVNENKELRARLRKLDDDFRTQFDAEKRDHLKYVDKVKHEYEQKLREGEARVGELEDEMRQILTEAETKKKFYEEKIASFSQMFNKFQADLKATS